MKKCLPVLLLLLSLCLLLTACGGGDTSEETTAKPSSSSANTAKTPVTITITPSENVTAYFDAYRLENPHTDIQMAGSKSGSGSEVSCLGCDLPDFEASGLLPDTVTLKYTPAEFDVREANAIPHAPESSIVAESGMKVEMERSEYPLYPEYIAFLLSSDKAQYYGYSYSLYKYIDSDWVLVPGNYSATAMNYTLPANTAKRIVIPLGRQQLGEGLYRVVFSEKKYEVEFTVSSSAPPLDLTGCTDTMNVGAFFCRLIELPDNVENAMNEKQNVHWPLVSAIYTAPAGENPVTLLADLDVGTSKTKLGSLKLTTLKDLPEDWAGVANGLQEQTGETLSPLAALQALLPELEEAEDGLKLTSFNYCHIYDNDQTIRPIWLLKAETADGDEIGYAVDALNGTVQANLS